MTEKFVLSSSTPLLNPPICATRSFFILLMTSVISGNLLSSSDCALYVGTERSKSACNLVVHGFDFRNCGSGVCRHWRQADFPEANLLKLPHLTHKGILDDRKPNREAAYCAVPQ